MALTPLSDALERILNDVEATLDCETVALEAASGRYCATTINATLSVPPADNSAMDGYAVASHNVPGTLAISQRVPAGHTPLPLEAGTAARSCSLAICANKKVHAQMAT